MVSTITAIRRVGRSRARRVFVDEDLWREVPSEVLTELGLAEGDQVDPDALAGRVAEAEQALARARALRLVAARERSSAELRSRLLADGYGAEAASSVCADLRRSGLLDDSRHAEALVRSLTVRGLGRARVSRELAVRGVPDDLAAELLEAHCDQRAERQRALALAERLAARCGHDHRTLARRILAKGYSTAVALDVAQEALTTHLPGETPFSS